MKTFKLMLALSAVIFLLSPSTTKGDEGGTGAKYKFGLRCDYPKTGNSCTKSGSGDNCYAYYTCS